MTKLFHYFFDNSIKRSIMSSFVFILLLPIGFFIFSLFENSWEKAQQSMLQKHELIASAMVVPISLFMTARQHSLQNLGDEILNIEINNKLLPNERDNHSAQKAIQITLDKYQKSFGDLIAISYISNLGEETISVNKKYMASGATPPKIPNYLDLPLSKLPPISKEFSGTDLFSPVFQSSISKNPVVLLKHYVRNKEGQIKCSLFVEIAPKYITDMCSKISFGDKGHCAIVDQTGHVVAHPNKGWIKEIRDLSKLSIIKKMLDGKSGTTEFYSPFLKTDMVAGFSPIPILGWGIMIPQPKRELTGTLDSLRSSTLIWLALGLIIALIVAFLLMQKITKPIKILIERAHKASAGYDFINLGNLPKNSPREINQLWQSISTLLTGLQKSNAKVKKLNLSLNRDINKATEKLQIMNNHLYKISSKDYLTSLANRRYFTLYLNKIIKQKSNVNIGLILIDIDRFKFINDKYGHDAGDLALKHLSKILNQYTRKGDLVARLGGDEFVVYIKNSSNKTLLEIAEKLRSAMKENPVVIKNENINLTLSMGIVSHKNSNGFTIERFLKLADSAMYQSKESGRNQVTSYEFKLKKSMSEKELTS